MPNSSPQPAAAWRLNRHDFALLLLGIGLYAVTQMCCGVGALAFAAPVPFLYFVRRARGIWPWIWLFAAILTAMHATYAKIITAPVSLSFVATYAVPASLGLFAVLWLWDVIRRRAGETWALYAFPALIVLLEWTQYAINEFGVWGTLANTQLQNLPLLQIAALLGAPAISFLIAWAASLTEQILARRQVAFIRHHLAAFALAYVAALSYGAVRLDRPIDGPQVRVATVSADATERSALLTDEEAGQLLKTLMLRSTTAVRRGAQIVVWNEAATVVQKAHEAAFITDLHNWARGKHVDLVATYVVPLVENPTTYENKLVWIRPNGTTAQVYAKHHPLPGEPCVRSVEPVSTIDTEWGHLASAICDDYDFPPLARAHARLGVGLVVVPASDWRGIDPLHTEMIRLRAIEGGFSVVRAARLATSAAYDAHGRTRGALPYFENNDRIMVVSVPANPIPTLYGRLGDVLVYVAMGFLSLAGSLVTWRISHARKSHASVPNAGA